MDYVEGQNAVVAWRTWNYRFVISVGAIVLTLLSVGAGFAVRYARPGWSWTLFLIDPRGALRARTGRWLAALGTCLIARWLVPKLTARYLEAGKLERLDEPSVS
jgi:hypothetical protein